MPLTAICQFVGNAIANRRTKQPPMLLAEVPSAFSAKAFATASVATFGKSVALDHDYVIHIHDHHGGQSEADRGQEPVNAADIKTIAENLAEALSVTAGTPPKAKNGAPRLKVVLEIGPYRYDVVFEVRRRVLVPVTIWKRRK